MRLEELLETSVKSSWIKDLTITGNHATMLLRNGKTYQILDIDPAVFEHWLNSPSKGIYYNNEIKDTYNINRVQ